MTIHVLSKNVTAMACAALLAACAGPSRAPRSASASGRPAAGTPVTPRRPGVTALPVDADGDGRPELWRLGTAAGPVGTEHDGNGDGRVDRWVLLDAEGAPAEIAVDVDFDGRPDATSWYAGGVLVRREEALPGLPRTWSSYEGGRLVRRDRDLDGDGRPETADR